RRLEHGRRDALALLAHLRGRDRERTAGERGAATARRADGLRRARGITVPDRDPLGVDAQIVGHDLRERRLVSLAVRARAGDAGHGAGALHAHRAALPAERRRLDIQGDAETDY